VPANALASGLTSKGNFSWLRSLPT